MTKDKKKIQISIGVKITAMVVLSVIMAIAVLLATILPRYREVLRGMTQNNMLTITTAYEKTLEYELKTREESYDLFADILSSAKLANVESSYAYLVDSKGTMLYHPTKEKVGASVENEIVKGLVEQISAGNIPQNDVTSYLYKGVIKYASYAILSNQYILVVTADEDEVFDPINQISSLSTKIAITLVIVFAILGLILSLLIIAPIRKVTKIILETADFNFAHTENGKRLCKHRDETGQMARAVSKMRENLRNMIEHINEVSDTITTNVTQLQETSASVAKMSTENSATTQQLAASMEETSATSETIASNIGEMGQGAYEIEQLSVSSEKNSEVILGRAKDLKKTTEESISRSNTMYDTIKTKTEQAIEQSKAVEKINELTAAIMAISSQTSLLALNASIEAARAGEAGRGFAVVASEIGNLAGQTSQTVGNINEIVKAVHVAVDGMQETLQSTMKYLEEEVAKDYGKFNDVSIQYSEDAMTFRTTMGEVHTSIDNLTATIHQITDAIVGINSTVNEAAIGVTDIAGKTSDVGRKTEDNYELVNECLTKVSELKALVQEFVL